LETGVGGLIINRRPIFQPRDYGYRFLGAEEINAELDHFQAIAE